MNKLLRFLMPKTARRLDELQREISKLEQENDYLKTRPIGGGGGTASKQPLSGGATTTVRNSLVSTSPVRNSSNIDATSTPTIYATSTDYSSYPSSPCDSGSSSDSGSCCCD